MPAPSLRLKTKRRVKRLQVSAKSEEGCHYPLQPFIQTHIACNLCALHSVLEVESHRRCRWIGGMAPMVTRRITRLCKRVPRSVDGGVAWRVRTACSYAPNGVSLGAGRVPHASRWSCDVAARSGLAEDETRW